MFPLRIVKLTGGDQKYLFENPNELLFQQSDTDDLMEVNLDPMNLPRSDEESNVVYLRRVVHNYCEKQNEAMRKVAEQISEGLAKVSWPDFSALTDFNSNIADSINSIRDSSLLNVSLLPDPQHKTNHLLADLSDIRQKIKSPMVGDNNHRSPGPTRRRRFWSNTIPFV